MFNIFIVLFSVPTDCKTPTWESRLFRPYTVFQIICFIFSNYFFKLFPVFNYLFYFLRVLMNYKLASGPSVKKMIATISPLTDHFPVFISYFLSHDVQKNRWLRNSNDTKRFYSATNYCGTDIVLFGSFLLRVMMNHKLASGPSVKKMIATLSPLSDFFPFIRCFLLHISTLAYFLKKKKWGKNDWRKQR